MKISGYKGTAFCWKVAYPTEEDAIKAFNAHRLLADIRRIAPPTKYYQCARCHFWHITTK